LFNRQIIQRRFLRSGLFFLVMIWFLGIVSPCFNSNIINSLYPFQKQLYSTVCHQHIHKSFTCDDIPLLVCARCTGIYAGTLLSALVLIFYSGQFNFKTKYLIMLSAPMLLDVILQIFGLYSYNKYLSSFTGFLFGSSVFLYILSAIENLLFSKQKNKNEL